MSNSAVYIPSQIADIQGLATALAGKEPSVAGGTSAQFYRGDKTWATLNYLAVAGLSSVAHSGAYSDLSGLPSLAAVALSGAYTDLSGRPTLATVATSGAYADLTGKPTLFTQATADGLYKPLAYQPTAANISDATTAGRALLTAASASAQRTALGLASVAATGAYSDLSGTPAAGEPVIAAGTTAQYWRGDKSWQTLDKTAVGLGNVQNTALSTWAGSTNLTTLGTIGTGTWNGTVIADTYIASAAAWNSKEASIAAGTTAQYWRGDKSWQTLNKAAVGLGNVDNTSDATKQTANDLRYAQLTVQNNFTNRNTFYQLIIGGGIFANGSGGAQVIAANTSWIALSVEGLLGQTAPLIALKLASSTGTTRQVGQIQAEWSDSTDASRKGRVTMSATDSAATREFMRAEADGTAARLGFYGATAVVKPTVTGSKASGAALTSLLAALVSLGLIIDSTSV